MASCTKRKDTESPSNEWIEELLNITGCDAAVAAQLFEACNGDLHQAVSLYMDNLSAASNHETVIKDGVRAPIQPITERLIGEGNAIRTRPKRQKTGDSSVFDSFRDFQSEARILTDQPDAEASARSKLQDLFRPPIDIIHKGTFLSARQEGSRDNKWVMVNIQNVCEFACQCLNRDIWSQPQIRKLLAQKFILWQAYHDSEVGSYYSQFYKVYSWPYVAVIDPRTGENMVTWNKIDPGSFFECLNDFLASYPSPEGNSESLEDQNDVTSASHPSILDADETSQIEAAIKASLKPAALKPPPKSSSSSSCDDCEELETFSDSDDGCDDDKRGCEVSRKRRQPDSTLYDASTTAACDRDGIVATDSTSSTGKSCYRRGRETIGGESKTKSFSLAKAMEKREDMSGGKCREGKTESEKEVAVERDEWKRYLGEKTDPSIHILLRLPDGGRDQLTLPMSSKLKALVMYTASRGYPQASHALVTCFPARTLSDLDPDLLLSELTLHSQETIFVQPVRKEEDTPTKL